MAKQNFIMNNKKALKLECNKALKDIDEGS